MEEAGGAGVTHVVRAVIVDDDANEAGALADLLAANCEALNVKLLEPATKPEDTVRAVLNAAPEGAPRVVLLDYRLEDNPIQGEPVPYRGGTVAGFLRDEDPDLPIVLLTSEQKLHDWVETRPGMKNVFDWTLVKSDISEPEGAARGAEKIVDFAHAWEQARGWRDDPGEMWTHVVELMRAPADAVRPFRELEAEPPRGDVAGDVIHWLLHRALRVPGPLIGPDTARVTLGLSRESFQAEEVQEWLEDAKYVGALAAFYERWWSDLVRAKLADVSGGARPLDASRRAAALATALGTSLAPEGCDWCRGERTMDACAVCGAATDASHCLRPLAAPLPAWADPEVVCYRCVATGRADSRGLRFPPEVEEVVSALKEDRIRPQDS